MERKSIGTLIAALRRANGMTQKELAEKLNVSDKAVSRWERDESLPDLTLLPLIADIFHITVDELLRGERKNTESGENIEDTEAEQARLRKQMKRVTNVAMARLRSRMLAVVGVGLLALVGAVICNFGFNRVDMAALAGLVIWIGAAAMLGFFTSSGLHCIEDEEYSTEDVITYRRQVIALCKWIGFFLLGILAMILPLLLCAIDAAGSELSSIFMSSSSWFRWSFLCGAVLGLCAVCALYFLNGHLEEKGLYPAGRHTLHGAIACLLTVAMVCTAFVGIKINANGPSAYMKGVTFNSFDDFKDFCESFVPPYVIEEFASDETESEEIVVIDGRELTYEEYLNEFYYSEIRDEEGNLIGRVDTSSIFSWTLSKSGDQMTFTAYTHADWAEAQTRYDAVISTVGVFFVIEPIIALIAWLIGKDMKKKPNLHK